MKRLLPAILVLVMLLTACVAPATEPSTVPTTPTTPTSAPTAPTTTPTEPMTNPTEPAIEPTEPATEPTQPPTEPTEPPTEPATEPTQPAEPEVCPLHQVDPYVDVDKEAFYADYSTACCYNDAMYRTEHYLLSGMLEVPGQYVVTSEYQPMEGDLYIRNTSCYYLDNGKTYVVVDAYGVEVLRIYQGAAYITLEEVAAYMYAFGGSGCVLPANYHSNKNTRPANSPWGVYLRVNHTNFTGDTRKYPYEPALPDITGCGGEMLYYELDIGTTGTSTPGYPNGSPYNNGQKITRGAARLVYTRQDKNRNQIIEPDEVYVFYTCNHYNDFQEYLNYYGGWGQMFGNVTGGGVFDSKTSYNPTPYPGTAYADFF